MAKPKNVLVSGFSDPECAEFFECAVKLSACIRVSKLNDNPFDDFGLETYLHSDIRAMTVPVVKDLKLSNSFKEKLHASTFD